MRIARTIIPLAVLLTLGVGVACKKPAPAPAARASQGRRGQAAGRHRRWEAKRRAAEEEARRKAEEEARRKAEAEAAALAAYRQAAEAALKDINFDFDKSDIREMDKAKLQAIADFMKAYPQAKVQIEGHCDERGTVEYNLALGERRAYAAQSYLVGLGTPTPASPPSATARSVPRSRARMRRPGSSTAAASSSSSKDAHRRNSRERRNHIPPLFHLPRRNAMRIRPTDRVYRAGHGGSQRRLHLRGSAEEARAGGRATSSWRCSSSGSRWRTPTPWPRPSAPPPPRRRALDRRFQADLQELMRQLQESTRILNNRLGNARPSARAKAGSRRRWRPIAASDDEKAFNAAVLDYNRGNYALSAESLTLFLKSNPQSPRRPDALFFLGLSYYNQKTYRQGPAVLRPDPEGPRRLEPVPAGQAQARPVLRQAGAEAGGREGLQGDRETASRERRRPEPPSRNSPTWASERRTHASPGHRSGRRMIRCTGAISAAFGPVASARVPAASDPSCPGARRVQFLPGVSRPQPGAGTKRLGSWMATGTPVPCDGCRAGTSPASAGSPGLRREPAPLPPWPSSEGQVSRAGQRHRPARRPLAAGCRSNQCCSASMATSQSSRALTRALGRGGGMRSVASRRWARQASARGHRTQSARGVQTVAPSSIRACVRREGPKATRAGRSHSRSSAPWPRGRPEGPASGRARGRHCHPGPVRAAGRRWRPPQRPCRGQGQAGQPRSPGQPSAAIAEAACFRNRARR